MTAKRYHVTPPDVFELAGESNLSLASIAHTQLDPRLLEELGECADSPFLSHMLRPNPRIFTPGESTQGVVAIRQDLKSPAVVQLVFRHRVKATFVL